MRRSLIPPAEHVAVRLDAEVVARIDAFIPEMSTSWRKATRSDAVRKVILAGLAALEAEARLRTPPEGGEGPA
jgi:hypothetical protein